MGGFCPRGRSHSRCGFPSRIGFSTQIREVHWAAQLVSSNMRKYNAAMQEMLDYAKGKGWLNNGKTE